MMHAPPRLRKRRRRTRRPGLRWTLVAFSLLGGCPSRFDPRADPVQVRAADPEVDRAYRDARARLDRGEVEPARDAFHALRVEHAADPASQAAALWEARADLLLGDPKDAIPLVDPLAKGAPGDAVAERARFLLGLALARSGEPARGRELLLPFAASGVAGDDNVELHASLAEADAKLGDAAEALREYERFFEAARPIEQAFIRAEATRLAGTLSDEAGRQVFLAAQPGSLTRAVLGPRLSERVTDAALANDLRAQGEVGRRRFGFPEETAPASAPAQEVRAVGVVLPLSGKNRPVGERALRGALLAAGALETGAAGNGALDLRVRDAGSTPEQAAAAFDQLAREGVAVIIGSPDRVEAQAMAVRAQASGVPLLDLAPDEAGARAPATEVFKLLRPNALRAAALADRALSSGARRFAVLAPDSPYGRKMAEAFAQAVRGGGGTVLGEVHFEEKATTFINPAKQVAALHPDAVFVPAPAVQLELVAAQLAAFDVTRASRGATGKSGAPSAGLYATADGLSAAKFLANAGRYVQGAVLAPVFYPDARLQPVADRFRENFGDDPGTAEALAYDAVLCARTALASAPNGVDLRRALADRLRAAAPATSGLTGPLGFGPGGERTGRAQLYVVDGEQIRPLP